MKTIKWAVTIAIFFALVSVVPTHSSAQFQFTDVSKNDEHYEQVHYIAELGIINKVAKFNPNDNLTRAQAAKMLVIATKKQNIPTPSIKFKDLKAGTEQYEFASRAVSLGYFKTAADGSFKPNEKLKRGEMGNALAVAFNLSEKITADHPLLLSDMKGHAYAERINGLYYAGITQGDSGKFLPNNHLTRKHFALFVARALNDKYKLPVKSPDQTSSTYFVKVNTGGDTLNVRTLPSVDGSIIARLKHGDIVEVIAQSGDWLLVLLDDEEGYINGRYTVEVGTELPEPPVQPEQPSITSDLLGKVTVSSLNMREGPGTNSVVISTLKKGQTVSVLSLDGNWAKIHVNSQTGYVHKSYLKLLNQKGGALKDRIIVIDAGHGAHDGGATKNKVTEKSITLKVAKLVEGKLQKAGAKVLMTRSNDTFLSLEERTEFAKKHYAEAFVSIHVNSAAASSAKGTETYFDSSTNANSAESKSLATYIQNNLVKRADMVNRGVKDNRFYVIRNNNIAAVLVELAFISNADDFKKLTSDEYLEIYAESIYQGLVQYYSAP
ncbi:N-acetylmuramoyl-L-alanine amidase [Sporosarcina soli]|uniref:N-acetylmuramoyl-L-alanine amidase n=1 Tax=Sporosarcina soli TaxID=334736 RepID=A0ABW0TIP8_9BACL